MIIGLMINMLYNAKQINIKMVVKSLKIEPYINFTYDFEHNHNNVTNADISGCIAP